MIVEGDKMISQWILKRCTTSGVVNREKVGMYSSFVGMFTNVFLSLLKLLTGFVFHSLAIMADGFNNLADALSMFVVLFSFKLSHQPADKEHPYGHQRMEYIASMIVGVSILFVCYELVKSSISKILHPEEVVFSSVMVIVLFASIVIKMWLSVFYKQCAKRIDSLVLLASSHDSKSDVLSTSVILIGAIISSVCHLSLDGYLGLFVAILIFKGALEILKDAMNKILGEAPSEEFVEEIKKKIKSYDGVLGIHDLIVHSYGPERLFVCVHVEVDYRVDILQSHELIDKIEKDFLVNDNLQVVIHMDPIDIDDPEVKDLYLLVKKCIKDMSADISMHDFRTVISKSHTNLIFDCEIPYSSEVTFEMVQKRVDELLETLPGKYFAQIQFERPYN